MLEQIAEAMLAARAALLEQFIKLHKAVLKIVRPDEVCRRFMTTPSVGTAWTTRWVVRITPWGEGEEAVLRYLARYVFR